MLQSVNARGIWRIASGEDTSFCYLGSATILLSRSIEADPNDLDIRRATPVFYRIRRGSRSYGAELTLLTGVKYVCARSLSWVGHIRQLPNQH